jgi:hypothetical protein
MYVAGAGGRSLTKQMVRRRRRKKAGGDEIASAAVRQPRNDSVRVFRTSAPRDEKRKDLPKPEGRGDATGRAEESRSNFEF